MAHHCTLRRLVFADRFQSVLALHREGGTFRLSALSLRRSIRYSELVCLHLNGRVASIRSLRLPLSRHLPSPARVSLAVNRPTSIGPQKDNLHGASLLAT